VDEQPHLHKNTAKDEYQEGKNVRVFAQLHKTSISEPKNSIL
jgi:hypothetical protein